MGRGALDGGRETRGNGGWLKMIIINNNSLLNFVMNYGVATVTNITIVLTKVSQARIYGLL